MNIVKDGVFDTVRVEKPSTIQTLATENCAVRDIFLPPRLTTAEAEALTPVTGMLIYNTDVGSFYGFTGSIWREILFFSPP